MNKKLRTNHIFILLAIALSACQQDDALTDVNSTPSDKGRVMVTIREKATRPATRGETGNWLDPVGNNELINKSVFIRNRYCIFFSVIAGKEVE